MEPSKKHKKTVASNKDVTIAHQVETSGPLPDPQMLAQYEQVKAGFAERLIVMAEKEQNERLKNQQLIIQIEQDANKALNKNIQRGQIFALIAVFSMIGYCSYLAFLGDTEASADAAKYIIIGLAAVFITGRVASEIIKKEPSTKNIEE